LRLCRDGEKEIGGFAGLTGGVENRAAVGFQDRQPVRQIVGVTYLWDDPQMGAQEGAGQFGNQFFAGVGRRAEPPCQVAGQPRGVGCPVGLMPISA
jgi:hypothetical protein